MEEKKLEKKNIKKRKPEKNIATEKKELKKNTNPFWLFSV